MLLKRLMEGCINDKGILGLIPQKVGVDHKDIESESFNMYHTLFFSVLFSFPTDFLLKSDLKTCS